MYKKERLADLLHSFLASELRQLHDQAYSLVTITEVRPSKDYKSAKIYWTMPGDAAQGESFPQPKIRREMQSALESRIPFFKRRIAEELNLRFVPDIAFTFDDSAERGSRIDELLKKAGY